MSQWGSEAQHTSSRVTKKLAILSLLASCAVTARALLASRGVGIFNQDVIVCIAVCFI